MRARGTAIEPARPACPDLARYLRTFERDASGLEAAAARHAPQVERDGQARCAQPRAAAWLPQHHRIKHGLRPVPAPAQPEIAEADLEPRLVADQLLERGTVLRCTRRRQLEGDQRDREENRDRAKPQQHEPQRREP
jgi:hypothetical protein